MVLRLKGRADGVHVGHHVVPYLRFLRPVVPPTAEKEAVNVLHRGKRKKPTWQNTLMMFNHVGLL
jgi:hypothetical protein